MLSLIKETQHMIIEEKMNFKIIYRAKYINFDELDRDNIINIKDLKKALVIYLKQKYNMRIFNENIVLSKQFEVLHDEEKVDVLENKIILMSIIPIVCNKH